MKAKTNEQAGRYVSPDAIVLGIEPGKIVCQSSSDSSLDNEDFSMKYDFKW